ncbi:MAG: carbamoyltransferase HypF [Lentisphaerae bacterium]|nr:carbamoyltransferase HypF [Lentisphaerota bacterium]
MDQDVTGNDTVSAGVSRLSREPGRLSEGIDLPVRRVGGAGLPSVLATGAELKNTVCVTAGNTAYVSSDIGDLSEYRAYRLFLETVKMLPRLAGADPTIVAHDLHPDYHGTRYALGSGIPTCEPVQHHHAHIAACMAEPRLAGPVIGIALDGMGIGDDGTMWGGEFFVADLGSYRRVCSLKPYRLPGGDEATKNPERMAFSCLVTEGVDEQTIARILPGIDAATGRLIRRMLETEVRSPLTSSAGRLFDAVSALLGLCYSISFEAEAAILLQQTAVADVDSVYPFRIENGILDFGPMIREIVSGGRAGQDVASSARMFHNTLAAGALAVCRKIQPEEGIRTVVLGGGVFQNSLLLDLTSRALRDDGFEVYTPRRLPPTDAALSLGQAAIALARTQVTTDN